ncbi:MAG: hypothetical protein Q9183_001649 [Haloplaca sp. 2 TL-2023]
MAQFFLNDICTYKNPTEDIVIHGSLTYVWNHVDQPPIDLESKDFLVPKNLPEHIRAQIERTKLVPRGYAVIEDLHTGSGVLVPEDFLHLDDRYFSRGDVVKRSPSDAQSGTTIANSVVCTLQPCIRVPHVAEGYFQEFELPVGLTGDNPRIVSHGLMPYRRWNKGDSAFQHNWVGSVIDPNEHVTLLLENGSIVECVDSKGLRAKIQDPLDAESPFVPMHAKTRDIKAGSRWANTESFSPGQTVSVSKKALSKSECIYGIQDGSCRRGLILSVSYRPVQVDWKLPRTGEPDENFVMDPFYSTEAGGPYDRSRGIEMPEFPLREPPYEAVHQDMSIGEFVVINNPSSIEMIYRAYEWQHVNIPTRVPERDGWGLDFVVARIIDTSNRATVQWQDSTVTKERGTSICPYTEVDDYEVWPGELVSLKEQEEKDQSVGFETFTRTRMVGVVQSVNAAERVASIRWFEAADVTLSGVFAQEVVWPHSTFGKLGERITENSLYEIAGHWGLVKRRGDTVRITHPEKLFLATPMYEKKRAMPTDIPFVRPSDDAIDWFGEIVDLTLDGRLVVRLGRLDEVKDVICEYSNITVITSADDDTTDTESDDSAATDEPLGLQANQLAKPEKTTIEYDGPVPSEANDQQWDTESESGNGGEGESQSGNQSQPQSESESDGTDSREISADMSVSNATTESVKDSGMLSETSHLDNVSTTGHASPPSSPAPFVILDGPSPEVQFDTNGDGTPRSQDWLRAVHREHKILRSSLPQGVYARTWENSMEIIRVLMVGPSGTPYALAPFVFDLKMHSNFPMEPPKAFFHSWTNGIGRVNPNLYEDGKVCLSLLGTWAAAEDSEGWVTGRSSILQVILSLLGLVLVKEPFYSK